MYILETEEAIVPQLQSAEWRAELKYRKCHAARMKRYAQQWVEITMFIPLYSPACLRSFMEHLMIADNDLLERGFMPYVAKYLI